MRHRRFWLLTSAVLTISACSLYIGGPEHTPHATAPDAGTLDDAGTYDVDAGTYDVDAGTYADAGTYEVDGGTYEVDAGGCGGPDGGLSGGNDGGH